MSPQTQTQAEERGHTHPYQHVARHRRQLQAAVGPEEREIRQLKMEKEILKKATALLMSDSMNGLR